MVMVWVFIAATIAVAFGWVKVRRTRKASSEPAPR